VIRPVKPSGEINIILEKSMQIGKMESRLTGKSLSIVEDKWFVSHVAQKIRES